MSLARTVLLIVFPNELVEDLTVPVIQEQQVDTKVTPMREFHIGWDIFLQEETVPSPVFHNEDIFPFCLVFCDKSFKGEVS